MNPTTDVFEQRIAALEGATGALAWRRSIRNKVLPSLPHLAEDEVVSHTSAEVFTSFSTTRCRWAYDKVCRSA
jgi:O-acetylhomoserine/O-acetylserine sulfhydrylase-like pyridoxal-dependent enzyme